MRCRIHGVKVLILAALLTIPLAVSCGGDSAPAAPAADRTATALTILYATKDAAVPETPPPDPAATMTAEALLPLKAPDYKPPGAAGICLGPVDGPVAEISINPDVPSPRCLRVTKAQRLLVRNNTSEAVRFVFGHFDVQLAAGASQLLDEPAGDYLAPGGHVLESNFGQARAAVEVVE